MNWNDASDEGIQYVSAIEMVLKYYKFDDAIFFYLILLSSEKIATGINRMSNVVPLNIGVILQGQGMSRMDKSPKQFQVEANLMNALTKNCGSDLVGSRTISSDEIDFFERILVGIFGLGTTNGKKYN